MHIRQWKLELQDELLWLREVAGALVSNKSYVFIAIYGRFIVVDFLMVSIKEFILCNNCFYLYKVKSIFIIKLLSKINLSHYVNWFKRL